MMHREEFEANQGYRFFRKEVSILVGAISYGRRLNDDQLAKFVEIIGGYLDAVSGKKPIRPFFQLPLTADRFSAIKGPFYKFVSDETLKYLKKGSFQFGTASYYAKTSNEGIQDEREGSSTFHIGCNDNQMHVSLMSGFNCALFCGTANKEAESSMMRATFGENLIVIREPEKFMNHVATILGAKKASIYDVIYTNLKHFTLESRCIAKFPDLIGNSSLNAASLHKINENFFQVFYEAAFMPSLFSKPMRYVPERERRMIFELQADISTPTLIVDDASLLNYVEFP